MPAAEPTAIDGVLVVEPTVHADDRGLFVETFRQEWLPGTGPMVQGNRADRRAGTVVGLHFHLRQSDYWYVTAGRARVVLHDLREGSPSQGTTVALDLGGDVHRGVLIPPGVGHGFAAVTDVTITYLVDRYYDPADELGIRWDDPAVAGHWGLAEPQLSDRDRSLPLLAELPEGERPTFVAS